VEVSGDDIDTAKPILWIHGNKYRGKRWPDALERLCPNGWTLVCLPSNRIDKFKRIMTSAEQVEQFVDRKGKEYLDGLSDTERLSVWLDDNYMTSTYKDLDPAKVQDPDLTTTIEAARLVSTKHQNTLSSYGVTIPRPEGWTDPLTKYPLFDERVARLKPDHVYMYLNAAYKENH
jgi:hypothetical protein